MDSAAENVLAESLLVWDSDRQSRQSQVSTQGISRTAKMGQAGNAMHTQCVGLAILCVLSGCGNTRPTGPLGGVAVASNKSQSVSPVMQLVARVIRGGGGGA